MVHSIDQVAANHKSVIQYPNDNDDDKGASKSKAES